MFRPLVAVTAVLLVAQGAWELFARQEPLGALLMVIGLLVGSIGATAAPYVSEIERRRRGRC
jgi:nitrate/nitrite transporter NarK